jgi:hypothetical protein
MFPSREEVLNGNSQYLREEHEVFVVYKAKSCFDFRNAAAADVEAGELKFCGEHGLRPAEGVASARAVRSRKSIPAMWCRFRQARSIGMARLRQQP